jgi:glycosyltransferase involved in cell wall biosynthesis
MREQGANADLVLRRADGAWIAEPSGLEDLALSRALRRYRLVVVQYNPFLWGRRGFAPWLILALWRLRLRRSRPRTILFVHETYLDLRLPWRWAAMALWQRVQLRLILPAADVVLASIEQWANAIEAMRPARPTRHLPIASVLPDRRAMRGASRARLGIGSDDLVVATLSGGERTRHLELVAAAVGGAPVTVLLALGSGGEAPPGLPERIRVVVPGPVSDEELADLLAAADVFLAPLDDGVSTRRTSVMAALQHALPVVATRGHLTDRLWLGTAPGVRLAPVDRPDLFAAATAELADPERRRAGARAARDLYESRFDWPVTVAAILAEVPR